MPHAKRRLRRSSRPPPPPLRASCFALPKIFRVTENTACCVPEHEMFSDTKDSPPSGLSRYRRRPARRGARGCAGIIHGTKISFDLTDCITAGNANRCHDGANLCHRMPHLQNMALQIVSLHTQTLSRTNVCVGIRAVTVLCTYLLR